MSDFRRGDKVKVKQQSSSRFRGCIGTVVGTQVHGLALTYEVSFDQTRGFLAQDNHFFEYELEPIYSSVS